ncbi:MAG: GDP-mannose 4,6-dehydratase [Gemmataceae bacterium]
MSFADAYRNRHILVTGAGGFIGSHLTEALVSAGACVRAMLHYSPHVNDDNLVFLPDEQCRRLEIIRGDIRDPYFVVQAAQGIDVIFHLAALIGIPYSYEAPADYVQTNIMGTLHVLEAARHHRVDRVVHTSTSETYGTAQYRPIDEKHQSVAQSPYAATKIGADKLAKSYYHSFRLPVVVVRPFNTFGPRQSDRAIVPTILAQLLLGQPQLRLGSLSPERDFTYVTDTVAGMLALGACEAAIGKAINLGTGSAVSIGVLANKCMEITGREIPIVTDSARVRPIGSEILALVSDNRLAAGLTGWRPLISLDEGLRHCAEFIRAHPQLYKPKEYQR